MTAGRASLYSFCDDAVVAMMTTSVPVSPTVPWMQHCVASVVGPSNNTDSGVRTQTDHGRLHTSRYTQNDGFMGQTAQKQVTTAGLEADVSTPNTLATAHRAHLCF